MLDSSGQRCDEVAALLVFDEKKPLLGFHAFLHLLSRSNDRCSRLPAPPNRKEFEAVGIASCVGHDVSQLMQPNGSNYDIAILLANFDRHRLKCFPMNADELQGTAGT